MAVLSIQSEVVRGHVGNGAARFALQRVGIDVWALPTVLLSNHPGHGRFKGEAVAAQRLGDLVQGLDENGWLTQCDGIVSGYLGDAAQARVIGDAVRRVKAQNSAAIYLCDPVFGDDDGAYARPGVAEAIARELLPLADIVTPNRFELQSLTSRKVDDAASAVAAARALGAREVVVTSVSFAGGQIGTIAVTPQGAWATAAERLTQVPHGSGDLLAALYLGARINRETPDAALGRATSAVDGVLRASVGADELKLVACQNLLNTAEPHLSIATVRG